MKKTHIAAIDTQASTSSLSQMATAGNQKTTAGNQKNNPGTTPLPGSTALIQKVLSELETQNEELQVTQEELQVQNEMLEAAAQTLEAERSRYRDLFHTSPDPSFLTDLEGVVQEANPAAHALLGVGPRSLKGKPLAVFIALDCRHRFRTKLLGKSKTGEQGLYLQPRRGPLVHATLRVSPVPDKGGEAVGLRWLVRGVTPDPGRELMRYRQLIQEVRDFAIFTLDTEGRFTSWNAGAELLFGYLAAEVLGLSADILFTLEDRAAGILEQLRAQAEATGRAEDDRWHVRKDGSRLWTSGVLTALRDAEGGPTWYAKIVRDLTERHLQGQPEAAACAT